MNELKETNDVAIVSVIRNYIQVVSIFSVRVNAYTF